ncbi:MAG: hypothetical protein FWE77_02435 [Clostridia bacterium]|nr:hypothetical protein [Clostridia bacterium]
MAESLIARHCEERINEAIRKTSNPENLDCFTSFAMTDIGGHALCNRR